VPSEYATPHGLSVEQQDIDAKNPRTLGSVISSFVAQWWENQSEPYPRESSFRQEQLLGKAEPSQNLSLSIQYGLSRVSETLKDVQDWKQLWTDRLGTLGDAWGGVARSDVLIPQENTTFKPLLSRADIWAGQHPSHDEVWDGKTPEDEITNLNKRLNQVFLRINISKFSTEDKIDELRAALGTIFQLDPKNTQQRIVIDSMIGQFKGGNFVLNDAAVLKFFYNHNLDKKLINESMARVGAQLNKDAPLPSKEYLTPEKAIYDLNRDLSRIFYGIHQLEISDMEKFEKVRAALAQVFSLNPQISKQSAVINSMVSMLESGRYVVNQTAVLNVLKGLSPSQILDIVGKVENYTKN
jgi:hypothetical protein